MTITSYKVAKVLLYAIAVLVFLLAIHMLTLKSKLPVWALPLLVVAILAFHSARADFIPKEVGIGIKNKKTRIDYFRTLCLNSMRTMRIVTGEFDVPFFGSELVLSAMRNALVRGVSIEIIVGNRIEKDLSTDDNSQETAKTNRDAGPQNGQDSLNEEDFLTIDSPEDYAERFLESHSVIVEELAEFIVGDQLRFYFGERETEHFYLSDHDMLMQEIHPLGPLEVPRFVHMQTCRLGRTYDKKFTELLKRRKQVDFNGKLNEMVANQLERGPGATDIN